MIWGTSTGESECPHLCWAAWWVAWLGTNGRSWPSYHLCPCCWSLGRRESNRVVRECCWAAAFGVFCLKLSWQYQRRRSRWTLSLLPRWPKGRLVIMEAIKSGGLKISSWPILHPLQYTLARGEAQLYYVRVSSFSRSLKTEETLAAFWLVWPAQLARAF